MAKMATDFYELFSVKGDKRVGLFLDVLIDIYQKDTIFSIPRVFPRGVDEPKAIFTKTTSIPRQMQNGLYGSNQDSVEVSDDSGLSSSLPCGRETISKEWGNFMSDMFFYLNKDLTPEEEQNRLNLISKLDDKITSEPKTVYVLIKNLVQSLYHLFKADGSQTITLKDVKHIEPSEPAELNMIFFGNAGDVDVDDGTGAGKYSEPPCLLNFENLQEYTNNSLKQKMLVGNYRPTTKMFSFMGSKFIYKMLTEENQEVDAINFFDGIETKKYYRDGKHIVSKDKNGKTIVHNLEHFTRIGKSQCKEYGTTHAKFPECTEYIDKCLQGTDINECAKYLGTETNFLQVKDEIKNLDPLIIQKTINGLHLQKEKIQTSYSASKIWVLKDYNEWLCFLKKELGDEDYKRIKKNENLKKYVQHLIAFVNSEPAILNRDFVDIRVIKTKIYEPSFLRTGRLAQFGLEPNFPSTYEGRQVIYTSSEVGKLYNLLTDYIIRVRNEFNLHPKRMMMMAGGGRNRIEDIYENPIKRTYTVINDYYRILLKSLAQMNKDIAPDQKQQIEEYLEKLRTSEEALLKVAVVVQNYIKAINIYGEDGELTLSLNKMKELVDERNSKFERVAGKQMNIVGVFESLARAVDDNLDPKLVLIQ